jgi:hypothetical protein
VLVSDLDVAAKLTVEVARSSRPGESDLVAGFIECNCRFLGVSQAASDCRPADVD